MADISNLLLLIKDVGISSDKHALIIPPFMSRGKRVHPMPVPDPSMTCTLFLMIGRNVLELII